MAENETPQNPTPESPGSPENESTTHQAPEPPTPAAPAAPTGYGVPAGYAAATADVTPAREATRFRDTLWSFKAMLVVALASLLLGGAAGAAIVAIADDDHGDRGHRMFIVDRDGGRQGDRMGPGMGDR